MKTVLSRDFPMEGPLHVDIWQQNRLIPDGVSLDVKLYPSSDDFRLMNGTNSGSNPVVYAKEYKYVIKDIFLKICHVSLNPKMKLAQEKTFEQHMAQYPYWKSDIKTYDISQGSHSWLQEDCFHNMVPYKVIVGLVSSDAYAGTKHKNPFNFKHFNANYVHLCIDGQSVPGEPFKPEFEDTNPISGEIQPHRGRYVKAYNALFEGEEPRKKATMITQEMFGNGYTLYKFNIRTKVGQEIFGNIQKGNVELCVRFASALEEPVKVIVYGIYPSMMKIDGSKNVYL